MSHHTHYKNEQTLRELNRSLEKDIKTGNISIGSFNFRGEYLSVYITYDNSPNTEIQFLRESVFTIREDRLLTDEEIELVKKKLFEIDERRR